MLARYATFIVHVNDRRIFPFYKIL